MHFSAHSPPQCHGVSSALKRGFHRTGFFTLCFFTSGCSWVRSGGFCFPLKLGRGATDQRDPKNWTHKSIRGCQSCWSELSSQTGNVFAFPQPRRDPGAQAVASHPASCQPCLRPRAFQPPNSTLQRFSCSLFQSIRGEPGLLPRLGCS